MYKKSICVITLLLISFSQVLSQEHPKTKSSLSIAYGLGAYAVKDQYITKEKYSGTLPFYSFTWNRQHENYRYILQADYRFSSDISNNSVSTDITHFTVRQSFLYPVSEFKLLNKPAKFYLGPSTEIFIFGNDQQIAVSGFDYAQSLATLFSIGLNTNLVYQMSTRFQLETSLEFIAVSLGIRSVDSEEDNQSPVKLLTLFSGLNSGFTTGIRYTILNNLSANIAYKFEMVRISSWEPLYSASDNFILKLSYEF